MVVIYIYIYIYMLIPNIKMLSCQYGNFHYVGKTVLIIKIYNWNDSLYIETVPWPWSQAFNPMYTGSKMCAYSYGPWVYIDYKKAEPQTKQQHWPLEPPNNTSQPHRLSIIQIHPLRAIFCTGKENIYSYFMSFLHIDMTQVVEIFP